MRGQKQHQGGQQGHHGVDGILEGARRRDAQEQVPDDAAAHRGGEAQNADAENVHVLFSGR